MATTTRRTHARPRRAGRGRAEDGTLLALTLACYAAALACVLSAGYSAFTLAARDIGRQAAAVFTPGGF